MRLTTNQKIAIGAGGAILLIGIFYANKDKCVRFFKNIFGGVEVNCDDEDKKGQK